MAILRQELSILHDRIPRRFQTGSSRYPWKWGWKGEMLHWDRFGELDLPKLWTHSPLHPFPSTGGGKSLESNRPKRKDLRVLTSATPILNILNSSGSSPYRSAHISSHTLQKHFICYLEFSAENQVSPHIWENPLRGKTETQANRRKHGGNCQDTGRRKLGKKTIKMELSEVRIKNFLNFTMLTEMKNSIEGLGKSWGKLSENSKQKKKKKDKRKSTIWIIAVVERKKNKQKRGHFKKKTV